MVERDGALTTLPISHRPPWCGIRDPGTHSGSAVTTSVHRLWLVLLLLLAACGRTPAETASRPPCHSNMQAALANLAQAADPAGYAAQHDLDYRDGRVAVQIAVRGDPEAVAQRYHLEAQLIADHYYGPFLHAHVPLDQLCALSHDQGVGAIVAPASPPILALPQEQPLPRTDR